MLRVKKIVALVFSVLVLTGAEVAVAEVGLAAFEGRWEGSAVSESSTSVNFTITSRDIDVEIRPMVDNSFKVKWTTLQRQKGQPGMPDEVLKETEHMYVPTENKKVWHAASKGDAYKGETISWAALKGQTLTIYSMALSNSGGYDMLVYARTLNGLGMKLDFRAMRDGELRRTATGTLIKSGN